jgi:hypothetical protein
MRYLHRPLVTTLGFDEETKEEQDNKNPHGVEEFLKSLKTYNNSILYLILYIHLDFLFTVIG